MSPRKILVTGGAGFIGSHMAERLRNQGENVIVLDNKSTGLRRNVPQGVEYILGDVRNLIDLKKIFERGVDAVIHIAGQASNIRSFDDPYDDLETNVVGTLNVIQTCLKHRTPRLLFASSMTTYGHPDRVPVSEMQLPAPISYYGITKYTAERYVMATALRNDLDFKFNVTAFRMFNVYGERQRLDNPYQGALGFFLGNVLSNKTVIIHSDGEQTRDFVYIQDVVDAWVNALDNPAAYQRVYNLGFGEAITINRLVDAILAANGRSRADYPVQYGPLRPGDQRHMTADIQRIRTELKWQPQFPLAKGLTNTLAWAKQEVEHTND